MRFLWLYPHVLFCVKDSETAVIFLAVVAAEDPEFALVKRGCVVLDLRRPGYDRPKHGLSRDWSYVLLLLLLLLLLRSSRWRRSHGIVRPRRR